MKILMAVDGSDNSLDAVDYLVQHTHWYRDKPEVELVTVHLPVPKLPRMKVVVGSKQIQRYYEEEGAARLGEAEDHLDAARISYRSRILVGPIAETIVKHASATRCDLIFIGSRGMTAISNVLLGSTATKVLHLSSLPVMVVK